MAAAYLGLLLTAAAFGPQGPVKPEAPIPKPDELEQKIQAALKRAGVTVVDSPARIGEAVTELIQAKK